ncbi:MAG: hypothetical protein IIV99_04735 [Oscillospiraceae bacterium]|nr:hypothetical protein [Oscillospiraceae bacterium]
MSENTISTESTAQTQMYTDADAVDNDGILSGEEMQGEEFFDDEFASEENTLPDEELPQVEYEQESQAENPPQEDTVELTVYGEKIRVPAEEARAAAQKGMAFDFVKQQLAVARNDSRLKVLDDIARIKGVTVSDLVSSMHSEAVTARLAQQYGSIDSAPWQAVSEAVKEIESCREGFAAQDRQAQQLRWKAELREFLDSNPGCTEIPEEVLKMAGQGYRLSHAYSNYRAQLLSQQLDEAQQQIAVLKGEEKARKRGTPSARSSAGQGRETNKFLELMKSTW